MHIINIREGAKHILRVEDIPNFGVGGTSFSTDFFWGVGRSGQRHQFNNNNFQSDFPIEIYVVCCVLIVVKVNIPMCFITSNQILSCFEMIALYSL